MTEPELLMKERTASAGYRFPLASRPRSSQFHQSCGPKPTRQQEQVVSDRPRSAAEPPLDVAQYDHVTQDKIWKQSVLNEKKSAKTWEEDWGFLTEFDPKGRPITPEKLPDRVNMFSSGVPNTNSGNYGSRLETPMGQALQNLEFKFNSHNRKRKIGNDLICY